MADHGTAVPRPPQPFPTQVTPSVTTSAGAGLPRDAHDPPNPVEDVMIAVGCGSLEGPFRIASALPPIVTFNDVTKPMSTLG